MDMKNITKNNKKITVTTQIRFGKPCIKGTRIAVVDILNLIEAGYTINEIPAQYPQIKTKDVKEALRYTAAVLGKEEVLAIG